MKSTSSLFCGASLAILGVASIALLRRRTRFQADVDTLWNRLQQCPPEHETFSPDLVAEMPKPVRRYFLHAIAPGTPLATYAHLTIRGHLRLGTSWQSLRAEEIIAPFDGFVWKTTVTIGPISISGADTCTPDHGRVHFGLFGLIPVVNASGPDILKSSLGRLVIESMWQPASLLPQRGVLWHALDEHHIQATITINDETIQPIFTIDHTGRLESVVVQRWNDQEQADIPCGGTIDGEHCFHGYTIPSQLNAGWWYGTDHYREDGEFLRCTITNARFG